MTTVQTDAKLIGRGVAFPPRIDADGRFSWSSGAENVRESIRLILSTQRKERLRLDAFGSALKSYLFEPNTPATHRLIQETITRAVGRWEPRVRVISVRVAKDAEDPQGVIASINYRLVATQVVDRINLTLQLAE